LVKILVIIPTFNNSKHIEKTLKSIPHDFDICIIDSGSSDNTIQIAKKFTSQIIIRKMLKWDAGDQRNFAKNSVSPNYSYLFYLDSDEIMSSALCDELRDLTILNKTIYGAVRSLYHLFGVPLFSISRDTYHDRLLFGDKICNDPFTSSPGEVFKIKRNKVYKLSEYYHHNVDANGFFNWLFRIFGYAFHNGYKDAVFLWFRKKRLSKNFDTIRRFRILLLVFLPILYFTYYLIYRKCYRDGLVGIFFSICMSLAYLVYPFGFMWFLASNKK